MLKLCLRVVRPGTQDGVLICALFYLLVAMFAPVARFAEHRTAVLDPGVLANLLLVCLTISIGFLCGSVRQYRRKWLTILGLLCLPVGLFLFCWSATINGVWETKVESNFWGDLLVVANRAKLQSLAGIFASSFLLSLFGQAAADWFVNRNKSLLTRKNLMIAFCTILFIGVMIRNVFFSNLVIGSGQGRVVEYSQASLQLANSGSWINSLLLPIAAAMLLALVMIVVSRIGAFFSRLGLAVLIGICLFLCRDLLVASSSYLTSGGFEIAGAIVGLLLPVVLVRIKPSEEATEETETGKMILPWISLYGICVVAVFGACFWGTLRFDAKTLLEGENLMAWWDAKMIRQMRPHTNELEFRRDNFGRVRFGLQLNDDSPAKVFDGIGKRVVSLDGSITNLNTTIDTSPFRGLSKTVNLRDSQIDVSQLNDLTKTSDIIFENVNVVGTGDKFIPSGKTWTFRNALPGQVENAIKHVDDFSSINWVVVSGELSVSDWIAMAKASKQVQFSVYSAEFPEELLENSEWAASPIQNATIQVRSTPDALSSRLIAGLTKLEGYQNQVHIYCKTKSEGSRNSWRRCNIALVNLEPGQVAKCLAKLAEVQLGSKSIQLSLCKLDATDWNSIINFKTNTLVIEDCSIPAYAESIDYRDLEFDLSNLVFEPSTILPEAGSYISPLFWKIAADTNAQFGYYGYDHLIYGAINLNHDRTDWVGENQIERLSDMVWAFGLSTTTLSLNGFYNPEDFKKVLNQSGFVMARNADEDPVSLYLQGGSGSFLSQLEKLSELKRLYIDSEWVNRVQDSNWGQSYLQIYSNLDWLKSLTQLEELYLPLVHDLDNLSFLAMMPKLKKLRIQALRLNWNSPGFEQCTQLEELTLLSTPSAQVVQEISQIKTLKKLTIVEDGQFALQYDADKVAKFLKSKNDDLEIEFIEFCFYKGPPCQEFIEHRRKVYDQIRARYSK